MALARIASRLLLLVAASNLAQACKCMDRPACEIFSKSDEVVKALVTNIEENAPMKMQYTLKAATIYKGDIKRGQTILVVTANQSAACGVTYLVKDRHALVTLHNDQKDGDVYRINMCDYNKPWVQVPPADRAELKQLKAEGKDHACAAGCKLGENTVPAGWAGWGVDSNWCNRCRCTGTGGLMCTYKFCCAKDKCKVDPCASATPCVVKEGGKSQTVACRTDYCTCKASHLTEDGMDVSDKCGKSS